MKKKWGEYLVWGLVEWWWLIIILCQAQQQCPCNWATCPLYIYKYLFD